VSGGHCDELLTNAGDSALLNWSLIDSEKSLDSLVEFTLMRNLALLFLFTFFTISSFAQTARPSIGVTLSGGGAKGLAHIGILKAIDSAGLKVDYITGTSMGSIIGSLYAIGYSADTIEKLALQIDWDLMLSNQSTLRSLFMEEKDEYLKYDIELPWVDNKFNISTGFLEGEELWLKLSELYFPVYNIKDFNRFNIPFRCIATDVGNGEAVVLKEGEIISAIRASMAIPSVFTAMDYNGKRLVDGGISRNFPVKDVKEMGADYVIGSTVASGLLPPEKVRNVIQLLLQIAFFREAEDAKKEVPLCDIYIPFDMSSFNMGSFNDADKLLEVGNEKGRELYPVFKHLADSLDAIYGKREIPKHRLPVQKTVFISEYDIEGLLNTSRSFFVNTMNFQLNKNYTAKDLAKMVRQAFGTRYYSRITYSLSAKEDGSCKITFSVMENPLTFLKAGLHYNAFSGVGLIGNVTSRNFLIPNSRSMATINLGGSYRIRGEHLQYLGRLKKFGITLKTQFDRFDVTAYEGYKTTGLYKQNIFEASEKLHFSPSRQFTIGAGHRFEWIKYNPRISNGVALKGSNKFSTFFGYIKHNTLDRPIFPRRGVRLEGEMSRVSRQQPNIDILIDGTLPGSPDSIAVSRDPYLRTFLNVEGYVPLTRKSTLFMTFQGGINFKYKGKVMNEFIVGGMSKLFRNQITFAGLQEGSVYSPSMAAMQAGWRRYLATGMYLTARANIMFNNFISQSDFFSYRDFYSGYALTFSYNFALGPLDLSVMYSDQTRRVQTYINLGIPF
jgi:NTE family protein